MALSEEKWLGRRAANEMAFDAFFCPHCEQFNVERDPYLGHCDDDTHCPLANQDFQDAAEFEARVAANLAIDRATGKHLRPKGCSWYEKNADGHLVRKTACPPHHDIDKCAGFATCSLYHARLAVEAEMDA